MTSRLEQPATQSLALNIVNPLVNTKLPLPIELISEGGQLLWRRADEVSDALEGFVEGGDAKDALWEFIRLAQGSDSEIETFARKYGILGIRSDGRVGTDRKIQGNTNLLPPFEVREGRYWYIEDMRVWRAFAAGMKGTVALAMALHESPDIDPQAIFAEYEVPNSWDSFGIPMNEENHPHFVHWTTRTSTQLAAETLIQVGPEFARGWLAYHISSVWMESAALVPVLRWTDGHPQMHLSLGGSRNNILPENALFSVLVAQMAALVISTGMDRVVRCSVCGEMFEPLIKPGRHDRAFCPHHKIEGARERKRNWARKKATEAQTNRED